MTESAAAARRGAVSRRVFMRWLAAGLAAPGAPAFAAQVQQPPLIKPARLREGDLVGLIAPGGVVDDGQIEKGVRNLESLGLRVKLGENVRAARGNFAGTTEQRLADLHAMFLDREVKGVWTVRGGSGCAHLLPGIRYDLIRRAPKALVGFSDITALHLAIARRARVVTFHGPAAISTFSDYSAGHLRAILMAPAPTYAIPMAAENLGKATDSPEFALRTWREGTATGRLVGGNLAVLAALVGTPYAAQMNGGIAFIEEISEAPYRIDRMLTQLEQSGELTRAAAVMLGVFVKCGPPPGEASLTLAETFDEHLTHLGVPAVSGYSFGHIAHHFTIPMGIRARLDTGSRTLTLLEAAVA